MENPPTTTRRWITCTANSAASCGHVVIIYTLSRRVASRLKHRWLDCVAVKTNSPALYTNQRHFLLLNRRPALASPSSGREGRRLREAPLAAAGRCGEFEASHALYCIVNPGDEIDAAWHGPPVSRIVTCSGKDATPRQTLRSSSDWLLDVGRGAANQWTGWDRLY